jgi:hypothetical protein
MIITRLNGGLGNQMFQYALGRKMSLKNKDIFKLDLSVYTPDNNRVYELKHFNIIENISSNTEISKIKFPVGFISKIITTFKKRILRIFNVKFHPRILDKKGNIYLDGFWQSEKYFDDISNTLRQDFKLRRKMGHAAEIMSNNIEKASISVSVHIRRGDYVHNTATNRHHGTCPPEYYERAFAVLAKKLSEIDSGEIHLFVFSDDIVWVRKNISFPYPTTFVSNPATPNHEELVLMSKCIYHIIANSSFSWWAAWLDPNPQKIVIAPAKWFNTKPSVYEDIVPNSWIKI